MVMEASSDRENIIYLIVERDRAFTVIENTNCTIFARKSNYLLFEF